MPVLPVFAAAFAGWLFGAVWYSLFAKQWVAASGVETDDAGRPVNQKNPLPYVISLLSMLVVAATLYYAFDMLGTETVLKGFTSGLGIGACFAAPWIAMNYGFAGKPFKLTLIDGGYAALGSGVMGAVITLF